MGEGGRNTGGLSGRRGNLGKLMESGGWVRTRAAGILGWGDPSRQELPCFHRKSTGCRDECLCLSPIPPIQQGAGTGAWENGKLWAVSSGGLCHQEQIREPPEGTQRAMTDWRGPVTGQQETSSAPK